MINEKLDNILEDIFLQKIIKNDKFCTLEISSEKETCSIKLVNELFISRRFIEGKNKFILRTKTTRIKTRIGGFPLNIYSEQYIDEKDVEEILCNYIKNDKSNLLISLLELNDCFGIQYDEEIKRKIKNDINKSTLLDDDIEIYLNNDKGFEIIFNY